MAELLTTSLAQPVAIGGSAWGHHGTWQWQGLACHWRMLGEESRPAVLLIHGFGAASGHWRHTVAPLVEAGWCVYAIDLIGFGASDQPGLRLDNRLWARQCAAFIEQVVGRPAVLVGNSLGSLVALTTAVFAPSSVRAVAAAPLPDPTLLLPIPRRRPPWRRRLRRALAVLLCTALPLELLLPLIARTPLLDLALAAAYPNRSAIDGELRRLIARPALRPTAAWALRGMSIAMALRPRGATAAPLLERMTQPLLVIWGRKDQLVPVAVADRLLRHKPDLELQRLDGLGHCPHDEAPQHFNPSLLGWLERLNQTAST